MPKIKVEVVSPSRFKLTDLGRALVNYPIRIEIEVFDGEIRFFGYLERYVAFEITRHPDLPIVGFRLA